MNLSRNLRASIGGLIFCDDGSPKIPTRGHIAMERQKCIKLKLDGASDFRKGLKLEPLTVRRCMLSIKSIF